MFLALRKTNYAFFCLKEAFGLFNHYSCKYVHRLLWGVSLHLVDLRWSFLFEKHVAVWVSLLVGKETDSARWCLSAQLCPIVAQLALLRGWNEFLDGDSRWVDSAALLGGLRWDQLLAGADLSGVELTGVQISRVIFKALGATAGDVLFWLVLVSDQHRLIIEDWDVYGLGVYCRFWV